MLVVEAPVSENEAGVLRAVAPVSGWFRSGGGLGGGGERGAVGVSEGWF